MVEQIQVAPGQWPLKSAWPLGTRKRDHVIASPQTRRVDPWALSETTASIPLRPSSLPQERPFVLYHDILFNGLYCKTRV